MSIPATQPTDIPTPQEAVAVQYKRVAHITVGDLRSEQHPSEAVR